MENLGIAFQLMIVGMSTVFIILLIVINLGKVLINLVNKYAPEEVTASKAKKQAQTISPLTKEIIAQAVKTITGGKGRVTEIVEK